MFQPWMVCWMKPSQDSSSMFSTYHSEMACLTRRVSTGVAFFGRPAPPAPASPGIRSGWMPSSTASSATPVCSSSHSMVVPMRVIREIRSIDSHTTATNRRSGRRASASRSLIPPSRGMLMSNRA